MVKSRGYLLVLFTLFVVLFVNLVSASFVVGNKSESITTAYGGGEAIRGWVNMSFTDEPGDSLFQDSRGNSIKLIDLLKKRSGYVYTCAPTDCSNSYVANSPSLSKNFSLPQGQSKLIGLRFTGDVTQVSSISFNLNSDAQGACQNQISVDILNDGSVELANGQSGSVSCGNTRSYGCFVSNIEKEEYTISGTPYCQRINLTSAPGFKIGTWIKKNSGSRVLEAAIYDGGLRVANCNLPDIGGSSGETSCDVAYPVTTPKEYYVCVSSVSGSGDYKIMGNPSPAQGCGFFGQPAPSSTPGAYEIFAEAKGFGPVGTMAVANSLPNGKNFGSIVYSYLVSKYGNAHCSPECVVPIKITSGANQQITLTSMSANYQKTTGAVTETNFYDATETSAKVTSGFNNIYLDGGNFTTPNTIGSYVFNLKFNNQSIVSKSVNITDVPRITSISPSETAAGFPTEFFVFVNSTSNATRYSWEFGDNTSGVSTFIKSAKHTYNSTGVYKLIVTVFDLRNLSSSRSFDINVTSPKNLINSTIKSIKSNLNGLQVGYGNLDAFSQESVNAILGINNATVEIAKLEKDFNAATTDAQYNQIITRLLALNEFPKTVAQGKTASSIQFFTEKDKIDLETVKEVAGGDYEFGKESNYQDAILIWNQENVDTKVTFKEIIGNYNGDIRPVVRVFEMDILGKGSSGGNYFLFVPKMENLGFEQGITVGETEDFYYVDVTNLNSVSFYTTEEVDFTNLPAFVSPGLNRLTVTDVGEGILPEKRPKWVIFILVIIFLAVVAFIVYIILQEWYKKRYEHYLFKNRNDLYNMVSYIHHAKQRGLDHKQIEHNLKKAKWSSEQIEYVMKKYAGKRTGMFEVPVTKLFDKQPKGPPGHGHPGHHGPGHPGNHPGHHKKI